MRKGVALLGQNKLAAAGCVLLVAALTALGVWTNSTSERQGDIERTVRVQHTEVVQALCNRPFTPACLRRAVNIVKTCQADEECARLLAGEPDISRSQADREFRVENPATYETSNSSREIRKGGEKSAPDPSDPVGNPPDSDGKGGGKQPSAGGEVTGPPAPAPAPEAAPEESGPPGQGKGPDGEGPPAKGAQGLVPSAVESVEDILGCVGKLDLGCTVREVGAPGLGPR